MIKLKSGFEVEYNKDFDLFFRNLLDAIIKESRKTAEEKLSRSGSDESLNDIFLKELMDNCIYITHQLFEVSKINAELSKFLVTGFIFNSIILIIPHVDKDLAPSEKDDKDTIH
ncbi:MAG: hypothetical protein GY754_32440 [bacterium]|nr:hypothetical protein [bacterium]